MGLFNYDGDHEADLITVLNKRHSDVGQKCTKCGSFAEYTNRPWCVDRACEYFCPQTLANFSAAELDEGEVPSIPGGSMGVRHESWPIHNPKKRGDMLGHWGNFLDKLDEWFNHLLLTAPNPSGAHVRLEVSDRDIPLNSPPFTSGAMFDIMKILRKRREWRAPMLGTFPMVGVLRTSHNNIEVFVDSNLSCDYIRISVGDWQYRLTNLGYSMYIDLTRPHMTLTGGLIKP